MPYLAITLLAPWFIVLGGVFWAFPRGVRTRARNAFDAIALLLAGGGSFAGMNWAYRSANTDVGAQWRQIFAALVAYGVFLAVMTAALALRMALLRRR